MIRRPEIPSWIVFCAGVLILASAAFAVHPVACSLIVLAVAVERFAEFLYRADQPRASSVLKGDRKTP